MSNNRFDPSLLSIVNALRSGSELNAFHRYSLDSTGNVSMTINTTRELAPEVLTTLREAGLTINHIVTTFYTARVSLSDLLAVMDLLEQADWILVVQLSQRLRMH